MREILRFASLPSTMQKAIDLAEFFHCEGDQRAHLIFHRDVGLAEDAGRAKLFCQRFALRHAAAGDHDFRALGDEYFRGPQTDAARCASNHRNPPVGQSIFGRGRNIPGGGEQGKPWFQVALAI